MSKLKITSVLALTTAAAIALLATPATVEAGTLSASLVCEPSYNGAFCEAFPQGSGYTYSWTTTGYAYLPYPSSPSNPFREVACWGSGSGNVTVTVNDGQGNSGSATRRVCHGNGGGF